MVLVVIMAALIVEIVVVQFHRSCEENIIPSLVALDALLLKDFTDLNANKQTTQTRVSPENETFSFCGREV